MTDFHQGSYEIVETRKLYINYFPIHKRTELKETTSYFEFLLDYLKYFQHFY